ncbi:BNR repeat-containing protein [Actinomadura welshii]|uniref:BNR repeat-containing protein n=1 Tax=Actinomadura welshii TaxID=3103817 RepID=UPI000527F27D|nr:BNR repeat-containing protein [Actinomadura madurae]
MAGTLRRGGAATAALATAALVAAALNGAGRADAAAPAGERAAGPALQRLKDTRLDAKALYFVSYDGLVNNGSFQQSGILTYAGYQYAGWYTADRSAVIARRHLPNGPWKSVTLPHKLSTDDSHNVISMGVSPQDGRLHVAMDTHGNQVYYTRSEPGLASDPSPGRWDASRFGPVQRTLDGTDLGGITYPQFAVTPERRLQLVYRTGGSGNGTNEIAEYDAAGGGSWTRLGKWSGAAGTYSGNGQTSTARNMYVHGITYGPDGRLHAAFTWREQNFGVLCHPGGLSNHDTGYVYSDDRGRTWRNDAGQVVGATGTADQVALDDPGLVVDPLDPNHALMNQESQAVDAAGRPHVVISYVPGRFTQCVTDFTAQRKAYSRTFHLTRDAGGKWRKVEIPVPNEAFGRSRIVFDKADNAYVIMPFGRIVAASKAGGWTDWKLLFDGTHYSGDRTLNAFGEVLVDDSRVATDGVLSVMYQQKSTGTTPSPIRVIDFKLG